MTDDPRHVVFFVDDEPPVCYAVARILDRNDFAVRTFHSAEECLHALEHHKCDLLIVDQKLPGMTGLAFLSRVHQNWPALPVLLVTGHGDIRLAVQAIKAGAADFLEKPLDLDTFLPLVQETIQKAHHLEFRRHKLYGKPLTQAEKRVLKHLIDGKTNRQIADELHRSIRTVEDHRHHIMAKLGARNVVDVIKIAGNLDLIP